MPNTFSLIGAQQGHSQKKGDMGSFNMVQVQPARTCVCQTLLLAGGSAHKGQWDKCSEHPAGISSSHGILLWRCQMKERNKLNPSRILQLSQW